MLRQRRLQRALEVTRRQTQARARVDDRRAQEPPRCIGGIGRQFREAISRNLERDQLVRGAGVRSGDQELAQTLRVDGVAREEALQRVVEELQRTTW